MSFQVKSTIASLVATIVGSTLYFLKILSMQNGGTLKLTERLSDWGSVILILIGVLIVFQIIIQIVFCILNKIVTNEDAVSITDELDKLVDLKSTRNSYVTFLLGFGVAMLSLILGKPTYVMFCIVTISLVVSGIVGDLSKLVLYRRGG